MELLIYYLSVFCHHIDVYVVFILGAIIAYRNLKVDHHRGELTSRYSYFTQDAGQERLPIFLSTKEKLEYFKGYHRFHFSVQQTGI